MPATPATPLVSAPQRSADVARPDVDTGANAHAHKRLRSGSGDGGGSGSGAPAPSQSVVPSHPHTAATAAAAGGIGDGQRFGSAATADDHGIGGGGGGGGAHGAAHKPHVVECFVEGGSGGGGGAARPVDLRRLHSFADLWHALAAALPEGSLPDALDRKLIYMDGDGDWLLAMPDEQWGAFAVAATKILVLVSSNCGVCCQGADVKQLLSVLPRRWCPATAECAAKVL
eukprot:361353-Chlamydomonas_euryale.AAC.1